MTKIQMLEWFGTFLSFTGTIIVAQHSVVGWWICAIADLLLIVVSLKAKLYGFFALCFGYLIINVVAGIMWSR